MTERKKVLRAVKPQEVEEFLKKEAPKPRFKIGDKVYLNLADDCQMMFKDVITGVFRVEGDKLRYLLGHKKLYNDWCYLENPFWEYECEEHKCGNGPLRINQSYVHLLPDWAIAEMEK